jgi:hypothetical protein
MSGIKENGIMKMNKWFYLAGLVMIVCVFSILSCVANSLYSVNLRYDAADAVIPSYLIADQKIQGKTISVAEFTDTRQMEDRLVIGRVVEKDGMKILVLPQYTKPTQALAQGIKEYLRKAGYKVTAKLEKWDLREENLPKINSRILVGGNIEEMEITCRRGFPTNSYKTTIKLNIILVDLVKNKIVYKSTVESVSSQEYVYFSEEHLGDQASIALGDSIEKVFEEKAVALKIKEILAAQ